MVWSAVLVLVLGLLAAPSRAGTSSPRKFFAYSLSNTRGANLVYGYSFFYVRTRRLCDRHWLPGAVLFSSWRC